MWEWLLYAGACAVILNSGFRLCRETDALASRRGWTRSWAGLILLATVTSLPELVTGLTAVTVADAPRIALGGIAGSAALNLLMLGGLAVAARRALFQSVGPGHASAAAYSGALLLVAVVLVLAAPRLGVPWVGLGLLVLPILYVAAMWALYREGVGPEPEPAHAQGGPGALVLHAALIVLAAGALPYAGTLIAESTGLGRTFVGGLFVAIGTTLPELTVTLAAWRIGAPDLALGNLLGSNLFNLAILGVEEAVYPGALLATAEPGHLALLAGALAMTGLTWVALRHPLQVSGRVVGAVIVALYLAAQGVSFAAAPV